MMLSPTALAEEAFQDWTVDRAGNVIAAQTVNASGGTLLYACYITEQKCVYAISTGLSCEDGSTYMSLVNSSGKGSALMLQCAADPEGDLMVFSDHDEAARAIDHASGIIGIAIPTDQATGSFHAFKFSMRGFTAASQRAASLTQSAEKPRNSTL
ncbi:hypothetical protein SAMN05216569_1097 [Pseudoxanthomonas sp. CF125]|nr:hypothetical protein SAMN05216569_1097 [Pseudoxanthomonas sp. CF125]